MKKGKITLVAACMLLTFAIFAVEGNSIEFAKDYNDPVLGYIPSDKYASYEDAINHTPSSPEAVRASKPADWGTYDPNDPASVRAAWARAEGGSSSSGVTSGSASNTTSQATAKPKPVAPTLTEYDASSQPAYVITSKKAVYDDFNTGRSEIGSVSKGTEVVATGASSNGFYRFDYTTEDGTTTTGYLLYEGKDNIVPKEDYDAAWSESNRVEATCTEDGYIEYTNSYSGLIKKDELKATGHTLGDEELTKEPTWTKEGEIVTHCAVCNEIIDSRTVPAIVPAWVWYLAGGTAVLCLAIIAGTVLIVRRNKRDINVLCESDLHN